MGKHILCVLVNQDECRQLAEEDHGRKPVSRKSQWILPPNPHVGSPLQDHIVKTINSHILTSSLSKTSSKEKIPYGPSARP